MTRSLNVSPVIIFIFTIVNFLGSCTSSHSSLADEKNYSENDPQYQNRYAVKFDASEKPLRYGYYYIVSQVPEGYRVRVFQPEKKILTEDKIYSTPALTLMHGFYESWWDDGSIREQGIYQYGRKNSVWLEHEPGLGQSSSGEYIDNRKEGIWTQLDSNGMVEAVYNYKNGKLHGKYFLYDSTGQKINEGLYKSDTLIAELFKQPTIALPYLKSCASNSDIYGCSDATLAQYIYSNLRYPAEARKKGIHGSAYAEWDVMPNGSITNIRIPQTLNNDIEAECRRLLKNMPQWMPAQKNGLEIKRTVSLAIDFKL